MVSLSPQAIESIQITLTEAVQSKKAPALIYGATSAHEELFCSHYGPQDPYNAESPPIGPDSVLWLCSQTKMITSIAVFQLIEAGKLTLETQAADIIPELAHTVVLDDHTKFGSESVTYTVAKTPILIHHLLNHTSGLFYEEIKGKEGQPGLPYTSKHDKNDPIGHWFEILKAGLPGVPLQFEPGTSFAYGYSTDILGFIVERVTGQTLEDYFKEHIFAHLGMDSTTFYLKPSLKSRLITLCLRTPEGENVPLDQTKHFPVIESDPEDVHIRFGGDGLFSTAKDYLTLLRHLLQILDGTARTPILSLASLKRLFEPSLSEEGAKALNQMFFSSGLQFGFGLAVQTNDGGPGKRKAGSGWWGGWSGTFHFLDPQTGVAGFAGSQLAPPPQMQVIRVFDDVQSLLYQGLK